MNNFSYEKVGGEINICVSPEHTFGTDSFLLSYYAKPKNKDTVCDLGTGCGIIPLLWFREKESSPKLAYAVDIQPQAIEQMKITKENSNLGDNFVPIHADLKNIREHIPAGSVDVVTCNPPYKAEGTGIISESHSEKIARHETLCTINDVCAASNWLLRTGGKLFICQLPERLVDVVTAMRENGIEPKRIRFVQNSFDSAPWLFLIEGRRNGNPFLKIDPPLIMRENGKSTEEMDKIYGMYGKV